MNTTLTASPSSSASLSSFELPISALTVGEIFPNTIDVHESWTACQDWDDPTAPRSGYVRGSQKKKQADGGREWIEFNAGGLLHDADRALILQRDDWLAVNVEARFRAFDEIVGTTLDDPRAFHARVGLVFNQRTSREYSVFCVEGLRSIALYDRSDETWTLRYREDFPDLDQELTFRIEITGEKLTARCEEVGFCHEMAREGRPVGQVGFRSLGHSSLYRLCCEGRLASSVGQLTSRPSSEDLFREVEYHTLELSKGGMLLGDINPAGSAHSTLLTWDSGFLAAIDWNGEARWKREGQYLPERARVDAAHRKIYTIKSEDWSGESMRIDGKKRRDAQPTSLEILEAATGEIIGKMPLPEDPDLEPDIVTWPNSATAAWDVSAERGCGQKAGEIDFILKRDFWDGWRTIWAYDCELNLLWRRRTRLAYGHHFAVRLVDLDGDGELEVLAGGTAFRHDGTLWWEHDQGNELIRTIGGGHYDAVWVSKDAETGRAAKIFLLAGSAGVFLLDPLTGKTLDRFHIGHAQAAFQAKLRPRSHSEQLCVMTRWGNPGIITAFEHTGQRLWSFQPDYIGQGCLPVHVAEAGCDLLWTNTSKQGQGLYDISGRLVSTLPLIRALWENKRRREIDSLVGPDKDGNANRVMAVQHGDQVRMFTVSPN